MFERFTNTARNALVLAQEEARTLQHNFIGTEHILLGTLATDDDVVRAMVGDVDLDTARAAVLGLVGAGDEEPAPKPPFTPRAKKVLELSLREALALGHTYIGPFHIVLGILREADGVGAQILAEHGVTYDDARDQVRQLVEVDEPRRGRGRGGKGKGRMRARDIGGWNVGMVMRSTPGASAVLARASESDHPSTTDYLLALIEEGEGVAAKVLTALGVTKDAVKAKAAEIGVDGTSDAPRLEKRRPRSVKLAEGVEVRVTDPVLTALVESGQLEELLAEVVKRAKKSS
jgi:ATP-dependent Clp protease ATP-binding subunit ClpA